MERAAEMIFDISEEQLSMDWASWDCVLENRIVFEMESFTCLVPWSSFFPPLQYLSNMQIKGGQKQQCLGAEVYQLYLLYFLSLSCARVWCGTLCVTCVPKYYWIEVEFWIYHWRLQVKIQFKENPGFISSSWRTIYLALWIYPWYWAGKECSPT